MNHITVMESQADGSLVKVRLVSLTKYLVIASNNCILQLDEIPMAYPVDNLNMDADGNIWAAGFPNLLKMSGHITKPREKDSPVALVKASKNKGQDAFYGQKYVTESVVEDDGTTLSGLTFAAYDTERHLVFAGGESLSFHFGDIADKAITRCSHSVCRHLQSLESFTSKGE